MASLGPQEAKVSQLQQFEDDLEEGKPVVTVRVSESTDIDEKHQSVQWETGFRAR